MKYLLIITIFFAANANAQTSTKDSIYQTSFCYTTYPAYYVFVYKVKRGTEWKYVEVSDTLRNGIERREFQSKFGNMYLSDSGTLKIKDSIILFKQHD